MKELSLNILDIAMNSVRAGATVISISIVTDSNGIMTLSIADNGHGMDEETILKLSDPFYTTRTTRKVGLGIPFFILAAEMAGGGVKIASSTKENHGTTITATFDTNHINFVPLGDIVATMTTLIQGNPEIDFELIDISENTKVSLRTKEIKGVLGSDVSIGNYEIIEWIRQNLNEQYGK